MANTLPSSPLPTPCALAPLTPYGAVVFCRVIDNFGDAGVAWDFVTQLRDWGLAPVLVIDHLPTLAVLVPELATEAHVNDVDGVRILQWDAFEEQVNAGDLAAIGGLWPRLVVETFGCRLPDAVERGMNDSRTRLWVNLEYLSAEDWVEGSHKLWGLVPQLPIKKLWFFPGFTDKTGGLLFRGTRDEARGQLARLTHFARLGLDPNRRTLFVFTYPENDLASLRQALEALPTPLNILLASGKAGERLAAGLANSPHRVVLLPPLSQDTFLNALLALADLAIIRGEHSFAYAQTIALPFIWSIYPTPDFAPEVKLEAWLARLVAVLRQAGVAESVLTDYLTLSRLWVSRVELKEANEGKRHYPRTRESEATRQMSEALTRLLAPEALTQLTEGFRAWVAGVYARGSLVENLLKEVPFTPEERRSLTAQPTPTFHGYRAGECRGEALSELPEDQKTHVS